MVNEIIQTERLELIDKRGKARAILRCDGQSGAPTLTFMDGSGIPRLTIGIAWNDMPSIQLNADDGTARAALIVRPDNTGLALVASDQGDRQVLTSDGLQHGDQEQ